MGRGRHRLDRVAHETPEGLRHLVAVDMDGIGALGNPDLDLHGGTFRRLRGLLEQFPGCECRDAAAAAPCESQQAPCEIPGRQGRLLGLGEPGPVAGVLGQRDRAEYGCELFAELVGEVARDGPEGLRPVRLDQGRKKRLFGACGRRRAGLRHTRSSASQSRTRPARKST